MPPSKRLKPTTKRLPELCGAMRLMRRHVEEQLGDPNIWDWPEFSIEEIAGTTLHMLNNWLHHRNRCVGCRNWEKEKRKSENKA